MQGRKSLVVFTPQITQVCILFELWLIFFFFPSFDDFVYQNTFPEFLQLRPGCSVDLFNSSYFSDCGKLVFPFIKSSDCITDCPSRQEIYGENSDFWKRSCAVTLFTDHDYIGWRQDIKMFPSLRILTLFIYMTSVETLNGISELPEFLPHQKQEEL